MEITYKRGWKDKKLRLIQNRGRKAYEAQQKALKEYNLMKN